MKKSGEKRKAKVQGLPPHANAEAHKKFMARFRAMSASKQRATLVRAGIYTTEGELTEHYRDSDPESIRKTAQPRSKKRARKS